MKNPVLSRIIVLGLSLCIILTLVILTGCSKALISTNIDELSLANMWSVVVQTTGVQEPDNAYLESLRLQARDGKIRHLDFAFYTSDEPGATMYHINFDERGKLDWFSDQIKNSGDMPLSLNPEIVFKQIDSFGFTNIRPEVSGFTIDVRKQTSAEFNYRLFSLYHLEDGVLTPLTLVKLSKEHAGLPIQVGSIARSRPPEGHFETYTEPEYWFVSEDLDRAETVEYLVN